jgi:hypothetical protein
MIAAALLVGVITFVRPVPMLPALPVSLLTLGLFLLVISGLPIELVAYFLRSYVVNDRPPARRTTKTMRWVDPRGRPVGREATRGPEGQCLRRNVSDWRRPPGRMADGAACDGDGPPRFLGERVLPRKDWPRIATRCDELATSSAANVTVAAVMI